MGDRVNRTAEPVRRLGHAHEDEPAANTLGVGVENRLKAVLGRLPVAGSEPELGVETLPVGVRVGEERLGHGAKLASQEAKRRHRRLDQAVLERTHVGLGVSRLRELALRQARARPSCLQPNPDLLGEIAVFRGEARPVPRLTGCVGRHPPDHTTPFKSRLTSRSGRRRSSPTNMAVSLRRVGY